MILKIIIILLIVIILAFLVNIIFDTKKKNKSKISFKESMDLVELPIVTFYNGHKKLNFLLDTGSNLSHINQSVLSKIKYTESKLSASVFGMEGNTVESKFCDIDISYKEHKFKESFCITNLDQSFSIIKKENGVQLHGILGNKFFETYKYILDFNELIAYIK